MSIRRLTGILGLLALLACLSLATVAAQEPIVIKFWSHDYPPREAIDRDIIARFEQDNPNIKVEYTIGPGDDFQYVPQLLTALAAGEGPDLFNVLTFLVPDLIPDGAVVPVDAEAAGYASQEEIINSYLPGVLETMIGVDGQLYALPTELGNYALFVNTALFREAGLDPEKDIPTTWEDLMALAPKLTKRDASGNIVQRAFDFSYPIPDEILGGGIAFQGMAHQLGGEYFNEERTEGRINTDAWVKTYTFVRDYAKEFGGMALTPSSIGFYEGNVAMLLSGPWYLPQLVEANNPELAKDVITAPFPRWKEGLVNDGGSALYAYGLHVNSQSSPEVQEAAWKLAGALTSEPERYFSEALLLQPKLSLTENEELMQGSFAAMFIRDMANSPSLPSLKNFGELPGIMNRALERILLEDMDVQESLNIANDELTALLAKE
ncbi:MAG: extracellular solute-binding protein [Chloroflexi bacterium]|nr:extracellular solute-binding protein [Chloroflexota bacterium]